MESERQENPTNGPERRGHSGAVDACWDLNVAGRTGRAGDSTKITK